MSTSHLRAIAAVAVLGCTVDRAVPPPPPRTSLDAARAASIVDSVRAYAATVARDITHDGPAAWMRHFEPGSAFFMASEGQLVFPGIDSAARGVQAVARAIPHIELTWGDGLRVDPLAPGLAMIASPYHETQIDPSGQRVEEAGYFTGVAEHTAAGWRIRDAHWSVAKPAP